MVDKSLTEREEERLLERDTRNILLGGLISMMSTITALYVVNAYLIPKTTAASVAEYVKITKQLSATSERPVSEYNPITERYPLPTWSPLSPEQISQLQQFIENKYTTK